MNGDRLRHDLHRKDRGNRRRSPIAEIYNQGIADRIATFETEPRTHEQIERWFGGRHPIVLVETEDRMAAAFARPPAIAAARAMRAWRNSRSMSHAGIAARAPDGTERKLVSRIFPENTASLALMAGMDFRVVGTYRRHGTLEGEWRDCVIVERLLGIAARGVMP